MTPITADLAAEGMKRRRRPVVALSDAAYHEEADEATGETRRICAINADVFDLETMRHSRTHGVTPAWYYVYFMKLMTYTSAAASSAWALRCSIHDAGGLQRPRRDSLRRQGTSAFENL